jgi:hypothetical protein
MQKDVNLVTLIQPFSKLFRLLPILIALLLVQLACGLPGQKPDDENSQATTIAQTVEARIAQTSLAQPVPEQATEEAIEPSDTPEASIVETTAAPEISSAVTDTPIPSPTFTATSTPLPCNWAKFVKDVTVPDGTKKDAGVTFDKTWRLKNIGSCPWTSGYRLVFDHGDRMGAPDEVIFTTGVVNPGNKVDITVALTAPDEPGTYQGFFKLKSPDGKIFGIGSSQSDPFWVKMKVKQPTPTPEQLADLTITNIEFSPYPPQAGSPATVIITVKNDHSGSASNFRVLWYAGKNFPAPGCEWDHVDTIIGGGTKELRCTYGYSSWYAALVTMAQVDVDDTVAETNEGNNIFEKTISVAH